MTHRQKTLQPVGDVTELPSVTFGNRSLMWWGTLGFMTIEGWTLALLCGVYLYLRQHAPHWPPVRTERPSLGFATFNLVLMLLSIVPNVAAANAAKRVARKSVRVWLIVSSLFGILILAIRWGELQQLNTRWDSHAYGSIVWVLIGFHTSLLVLDVADTFGITAFFLFKKLPAKALSDVGDNAFYWCFTVGSWVPVYLLVYVGPYLLLSK